MSTKAAKQKPLVKKETKESSFQVVAIGASAGGLEAIMELLKNLPPNTGMSFIYVQHLNPDHKSMLTQILSKHTKMKVQEIDDMDKIKPNNVFVIPYNKGIEVTDGRMKLIPRSESSAAISIDVLFSSLAHAQKERAIGVILSGSASDGTVGMKAIKHEGGLTFAQDDSAKFVSMPHSAISAGVVDYILSPKEIALELARLSKHPFAKTNGAKKDKEKIIDDNNPDLKIILNYMHKHTGVDFSQYKMTTIKRRITRRMLLCKINTLKEYAKFVANKTEEIDILYQDLLINVTSFFRDTDSHDYLKENLFPKFFKRNKAGEPLRIWVPACASGEEAYSIAMILLEIQDTMAANIPIQIFATDLSAHSIKKARIGKYLKQELETVSPKRIQRFFTKIDGGYRVNKSVREMCVFALHNILHDQPFSRIDFISCCNLFIYFNIAAQRKVVNTFHFALNDDGCLMLGKSENISASASLFTEVSKKYKIFSRKINSGAPTLPQLSPRNTVSIANKNKPKTRKLNTETSGGGGADVDNAIDAVLLSEFMPASVAINYAMEIVQFRGTTGLFLSNPKGKATLNVLKMARSEIAFELRNAISNAIKTQHRVRKNGIEIKSDSTVQIISIEVVPLNIEADEPLLLVLFIEQEQAEAFLQSNKSGNNNSIAKDRRIKKLEEELAAAHADALTFLQDQEAFTEELQSANEEVLSSNEELQTVNEELETSKEEIESANEELTTTNQELQTRNDLLNEAYEYSEAIVGTMHEPLIVLDKNLRVKSANKAFYKKFQVKEEETEGALLHELGNKQWNIPQLREFLQDILTKKTHFHESEIAHNFPHIGEKIMLLNASHIIQINHDKELILLSINDITEIRKLETEKQNIEISLHKKEMEQQKKQSVSLEQIVNQRTKDLMQVNKDLEKMNKELESFTFISSHDLQEPLRKIQILAGRILEKESPNLSSHGKNYFRLMQNAAQQMQKLIQDLLAFSQISVADRKFEATNLNIIIEEVKIELKEAIADKQAIITIKEICEAKIIPFQFRQLMYNLISNALKFSNPKTLPHIIIESRIVKFGKLKIPNLPRQEEYCHITIKDNGIGFEKEFAEKIFDVFQRVHDKEEYTGTGIGLAIVKKIVDNHNGVVTATSNLNKGATFDIYIPV